MRVAFSAFLLLCTLGAPSSHAQAQNSSIYKLEELTWPQIDALDRERTMFILPIGMIEEHGPHLPTGADTFGVMFEVDGVSRQVSRLLRQWQLVMMPPIHYGESGANEIAGDFVHPGTYGISQSTLRSLVAELGAQVAQNGFKWIFVMTGHGAPTHGIAINEACDFVSESFGVTMLHISTLFRADAAIQAEGMRIAKRHFSAAEISSFGMDVHAGVSETSAMLALRPDLVQRSYKKLPALVAQTREELMVIARTPAWQGYISAPTKAKVAYGRDFEEWWVSGMSDLIVRAAGGENFSKAARIPDRIEPVMAPILGKVLENERAFQAKLQDWLAQHQR
jgi:creatinine amidohydrolase